MTEPASFEKLEQQIEAVLEAKTTDFFELAEILDLNPKWDFTGADLSGIHLSEKDLSYANFTGAKLRGANISNTTLKGANFTDADLSSTLWLGVISVVKTEDILHHLSDIASAFDRVLDLARALNLDLVPELALNYAHILELERTLIQILNYIRSLEINLALDIDDIEHVPAMYISYARSLSLDINLEIERIRYLVRNLSIPKKQAGLNEITVILDQVKFQYLGATFRGNYLQNAHWSGAHLDGALMINCQGLTPEDIADLKARGVIFDDAPGERSPVTSPRSPVPV